MARIEELDVSRLTPHEQLELARSEIDAAERALELAMSLLELAPRADKVTVSNPLEQALDRLRAARAGLTDLEK
jgi:hypothetical protein